MSNDTVQGVNGLAEKTFEGLNVYHEYQCGVMVKVSNDIDTDATFANESKFTKMPKENKPYLQQILKHLLMSYTNENILKFFIWNSLMLQNNDYNVDKVCLILYTGNSKS